MPRLSLNDIENLPEDPRLQFLEFEDLCRNEHEKESEGAGSSAATTDSQISYMARVVAAARQLNIENLCDYEVPRRSSWLSSEYKDFLIDVEFFRTQLLLEQAAKKRRSSIRLLGATRDRLQTLVAHLKEEVAKADFSPARKDRLIRIIENFEKELTAKSLSLIGIAVVVLAVMGTISDAGGSYKTIRDVLALIQGTLGIEKDEQDLETASQLLPGAQTKRLSPPRAEGYMDDRTSSKKSLDEDIPF